MKLFGIILFFLSFNSMACSVPYGGPEYDKLIILERLKKNTYRVKVPRIVKGNENPTIILAYDKSVSGGIPIYEEFKLLTVVHKKETTVGYFTVKKMSERKPYLNVSWWPKECCLCSASANSGFIEVEEAPDA